MMSTPCLPERKSLAYGPTVVEGAVASRRRGGGTGAARSGTGAETRLVYSTGGDAAATPAARPEPESRGQGPVRMRLERRASSRTVTVLTGLPGTEAEIAELARELRAACGAGGTARPDGVELQGDQRDKAAVALLARGLRVKR
jgi:translation initiation factor 1